MVVQGVIKPPPEIRAVADRTALYVAKNGRAFESRILNSEKGKTPKFAFLHSTSPFHAYYEDRVKFYEEGGTDEKEAEEKATEDAKKQAEAKGEEEKQEATADNTTTNNKRESKHRASAIDPIAKALLEQRAKILRHRAAAANEKQGDAKETTEEDDEESAALSALLPPPELRFINIVAPASLSIADVETIQLVAQFTALDGKNGSFLSQFIHREWNNPRFAFAQPRHGHFAYFSSLVDAYRTILSDWTMSGTSAANDYIKKLSNNPDKCLETAAYWAEYKRDREERSNSEEDGQTVAVIDWHDFVIVETIDFAPHEIVDVVPPPPPPMLPLQPLSTVTDEDMDVSDEEEDEPIRVVPAYEHKMATQNKSTIMMIDPITGKSVSVEDMPEHMRIQLLDPKWAEERKKFQDKQKDSNLVSGDAVADNLARFTQAIGDSRDEFLSEADSKKKLDDANRVLREQAQRSAVGPSLPLPIQATPRMDMQRPSAPTTGSVEPPAKRAKVQVTHVEAPTTTTTVAAPFASQPPPGFQDLASSEDPFAVAGTVPITSRTDEPTGGGGGGGGGDVLLPEAEFAASLPQPEVTLQIRIPSDQTQMAWNFYGQIISHSTNVMSTIKTVKQELSKQHLNDMPVNKIQLKIPETGVFAKDGLTLAALNLGPTARLELVPRARGGRK